MKIYDALVIGSGYTSVGYAISHGDTVICEEGQSCDTGFYLPLSGFRRYEYVPQTAEGRALLSVFDSLSLFEGDMQNTCGFECGLCTYLAERDIHLLLKCRVVSVLKREDGILDATVQTNEGLTHILTRKIIDTRGGSGKKRITVLFVTEDIKTAEAELLSVFCGATVEPAFYGGRYALYIPISDTDENSVKVYVYEKWKSLSSDAKLLYIAPTFFTLQEENLLSDKSHKNPIEAFEFGYSFDGEAGK